MRWLFSVIVTTCGAVLIASATSGRLAPVPVEAQIVGDLVGQQRGVRVQRVRGLGDGGQRFIVDDDPFGGIERLVAGFRDDQGDGFAGIADGILGQQRLRQEAERLVGLDVGFHRRAQRAQAIGCGVLAR